MKARVARGGGEAENEDDLGAEGDGEEDEGAGEPGDVISPGQKEKESVGLLQRARARSEARRLRGAESHAERVRLFHEVAHKKNHSCRHLRKDHGAPEAATPLRLRQQPRSVLRHAPENGNFHSANARTVQTPSIAEVLSHGVDVIAIQRQLERAPHDPQAQKWHVSLRKRPRSEMRTEIRRAAECAIQSSRCHATGSEV